MKKWYVVGLATFIATMCAMDNPSQSVEMSTLDSNQVWLVGMLQNKIERADPTCFNRLLGLVARDERRASIVNDLLKSSMQRVSDDERMAQENCLVSKTATTVGALAAGAGLTSIILPLINVVPGEFYVPLTLVGIPAFIGGLVLGTHRSYKLRGLSEKLNNQQIIQRYLRAEGAQDTSV